MNSVAETSQLPPSPGIWVHFKGTGTIQRGLKFTEHKPFGRQYLMSIDMHIFEKTTCTLYNVQLYNEHALYKNDIVHHSTKHDFFKRIARRKIEGILQRTVSNKIEVKNVEKKISTNFNPI